MARQRDDKHYPDWVCWDCGFAAQTDIRKINTQNASSHYGRCDVCLDMKAVTEPRDFGFPEFPLAGGRGRR